MPSKNAAPKALLPRILDMDTLAQAWGEVRANRGAAGGDLITLARFERRLELNLLHLGERVQDGSYVPGKVRLVRILTGQKLREIAVWCVADRVLQRAVLDVLEPTFERLFLPTSFGYRPGRSVNSAIRKLVALRDLGFNFIVDADIRNCFPSLDHQLLMDLLRRRIADQDVLRLFALWLPYGRPRTVRRSQQPVGISLGAVVSPLLCNVYLHQLDMALRKEHLQVIRYADDFVILCRTPGERDRALEVTRAALFALRLELNAEKTHLTSFDDGFTFLGVAFKDNKFWYQRNGVKIEAERVSWKFPVQVDWY